MARLQLTKQELQDRSQGHPDADALKGQVHELKKELATVQEKINDNMEAICYQVADLMWY